MYLSYHFIHPPINDLLPTVESFWQHVIEKKNEGNFVSGKGLNGKLIVMIKKKKTL